MTISKKKILIVDDEELARDEIHELLRNINGVEIIGEADSVDSALDKLKVLKPDVVFLDIQMPGKSGFELVTHIDPEIKIVFITAYDKYAIRAFEINALDYLTKPIYPPRLEKSIKRIFESIPEKNCLSSQLEEDDFIFLNINSKSKFIKTKDIVCITSQREYTEITTLKNFQGLVYKSMMEWEQRLPKNKFIRIHRQSIINLDYVLDIQMLPNKTYKVFLKGLKNPLNMSRRSAAKLKKVLS